MNYISLMEQLFLQLDVWHGKMLPFWISKMLLKTPKNIKSEKKTRMRSLEKKS